MSWPCFIFLYNTQHHRIVLLIFYRPSFLYSLTSLRAGTSFVAFSFPESGDQVRIPRAETGAQAPEPVLSSWAVRQGRGGGRGACLGWMVKARAWTDVRSGVPGEALCTSAPAVTAAEMLWAAVQAGAGGCRTWGQPDLRMRERQELA